MGRFLQSKIPIEQTDNPKIYVTLKDLVYVTGKGERITVPQGYLTDGYSKPLLTKAVVDGSFGDDIRPALVHDLLCQYHGYTDTDGRFVEVSFKRANDIFYEAMTAVGMPWRKRTLYRLAVGFNPGKW